MQKIETQNKLIEIENQTLEKKLLGTENLEEDLVDLQKRLTESLDEEKKLFDENLKLLNLLKDLELKEQETLKNSTAKKGLLTNITDQNVLERKSLTFDQGLRSLEQ